MFYIKHFFYFIKSEESVSINIATSLRPASIFKIMKSAMFSNVVLIGLGLVDETQICLRAHQKTYFPESEIRLF